MSTKRVKKGPTCPNGQHSVLCSKESMAPVAPSRSLKGYQALVPLVVGVLVRQAGLRSLCELHTQPLLTLQSIGECHVCHLGRAEAQESEDNSTASVLTHLEGDDRITSHDSVRPTERFIWYSRLILALWQVMDEPFNQFADVRDCLQSPEPEKHVFSCRKETSDQLKLHAACSLHQQKGLLN